MSDLLKVLPIYGSLFLANVIFSCVNITFWLSKFKSGIYTLPLSQIPIVNLIFKVDPVFSTWWGFTLAAWSFNVLTTYVFATLLVGWAYKVSVDRYGVLYSAFVIGQIASVATHMLFFYLKAGEAPRKNDLIALILILVASFLIKHPAK